MLIFYVNINEEDESEFLWVNCISDERAIRMNRNHMLLIHRNEYETLEDMMWTISYSDNGALVAMHEETGETMPVHDHVTSYCFAVKMLLRKYGIEQIYDDRNISSGFGYQL